MNDRDPRVYIIMCVDTNLEVEYSTCHLFDQSNTIVNSRHSNFGAQELSPYDELSHLLEWGSAQIMRALQGEFEFTVG